MSRDEAQIATDWTHPVFQVRSQEKLDRLLAAGLTLVEKIPYAQLKIADIAAQADCSVGTFYRRFHDKRSFLFALQELANRDFLVYLRANLPEEAEPETIISESVSLLVGDRRQRRGLATASLRQATSNEGEWMPFYQAAVGFDRLLQARLGRYLRPRQNSQPVFEISFMTQAIYGILNQVTLIQSGPVTLDDPALVEQLSRMCASYLDREILDRQ